MTATTTVSPWIWNEYAIHYVEAGDRNRPPILLIHGFGASANHWRKNIEVLAEQCHVFAIDLLGFGQSAKPKRTYSTDLWCDQLRDFCQTVIQRPTVVAGNSLGGYVALSLAVDYPELTQGVILLNNAGGFSSSTQPSAGQQLQRSILRWLLNQKVVAYLIFNYIRQPSTIREKLKEVYHDPTAVTDQLVEDIYRPACDPGAAEVFVELLKAGQQGRYIDQLLPQLQHPLLTIWGDQDPWMDVSTRSQRFRELYPQLQEHRIVAGHCPHDECPETVNALMINWIKALFQQL